MLINADFNTRHCKDLLQNISNGVGATIWGSLHNVSINSTSRYIYMFISFLPVAIRKKNSILQGNETRFLLGWGHLQNRIRPGTHEEPPQWNYFIAMNDEQGTSLSDYRDKRMLDVKAFYILPLFFTVSALLVNTSRPMMSGVIESTSGNTIRETFNLARQLQDGLTQPQEHDVFQFIQWQFWK